MRHLSFGCYNLGPSGDRPQRQGRREIRALLRERDDRGRRRKVVVLVETTGWRLPWSLTHRRIRDTSTPGRANVSMYVLRRLRRGRAQWVDHERTWPRVLHPGMHPARATLVVPVEDWTVIGGHAPQAPRSVFGSLTVRALSDARGEWLGITASLFDRVGPVVLLSDPNGLGDDLVRQLGPRAVTGGTATEAVHGLGVVIDDARASGSVDGVRMRSDHRKALVGTARRR